MAYHLEGRLLEVCNCRVLCPCWVGEDPDYGTCEGINAWHVDKGTIDGVDVSGRTIATINHIPGNVLAGNWKAALYVDDGASPAQQDALISVFSGKRGGPIADLAKLIGEVVSVEKVPIEFSVREGHGHLKVGNVGLAGLERRAAGSFAAGRVRACERRPRCRHHRSARLRAAHPARTRGRRHRRRPGPALRRPDGLRRSARSVHRHP